MIATGLVMKSMRDDALTFDENGPDSWIRAGGSDPFLCFRQS
jgi:hypothetical protein